MRKLNNNELGRISIEEFKNQKKLPLTIVLENIRSAHNVGAIFRTSDAFLIKKIILCGITAKPPNNKIYKSALGSTNSVEWSYEKNVEDVIVKLKKKGHHIVAVEQTEKSISLNKFVLKKSPLTIIFGNEINGVSQNIIDLCDRTVQIPQYGTKHSLNVSIAAGIVIWEIFKKLKY